jgi:hypothetical protein
MFNTVLTTAHHWTLSWARWTQSATSYPVFLNVSTYVSYESKAWVIFTQYELTFGRLRWTIKVTEFDSLQGQDMFFSTASRPPLGTTQPPIQKLPRALSPRVKHPGWSVQQTVILPRLSICPPYVFMARCLIKHRHNFTFTSTTPNVIEVCKVVSKMKLVAVQTDPHYTFIFMYFWVKANNSTLVTGHKPFATSPLL